MAKINAVDVEPNAEELAAVEQAISEVGGKQVKPAGEQGRATISKALQSVGVKLADVIHQTGATMRDAICVACDSIKSDDDRDQVLVAFALHLVEKGVPANSAKTRKSEMKVCFDAHLKSSGNLVKMQAFNGGYHEFVAMCKELRGSLHNSGKRSVSNKLTDTRVKALEKAITDASAGQVTSIAEQAIGQLFHFPQAEIVGKPDAPKQSNAGLGTLKVIRSAALQLRDADVDPIFRDTAEKILLIVSGVIDKAEQENNIMLAGKAAERNDLKKVA